MSGRSTKRIRISNDVPFKEDQSCSSTSKRSRISEEQDVVPYANIIKGDKRISVLRERAGGHEGGRHVKQLVLNQD